jgi:hypothetical protein
MNDNLQNWVQSLVSAKSRLLTRTIRVEGVRKAHLGPRIDYARVEFLLEPAEDLDVVVQVVGIEVTREQQQFVESAIYGFLDVAMLAEPYPMKKMRVTVVGADFDPVSSNMIAFRLAGRDAAKKLLEEIRTDPYRV